MKKLLSTVLLYLIYTALIGVNCFGQAEAFKNPKNRPQTDAEWEAYIEKNLKPKINDTLITRLFEEADLVFEGELTSTVKTGYLQERIYHIEPYKIFKGVVQKDSVVKILANGKPQNATYEFGEWSHGYLESGVYFAKYDEQNNVYTFVNPQKAWVIYPMLTACIKYEKKIKTIFHDKILALKGAKYETTKIYRKKKENLGAGNTAMRGGNDTITGFSRDTVPAGRLDGSSTIFIYGQGFGTTKGKILLSDADTGGEMGVFLHPTQHILTWSDNSIQIIVPSMGYAANDGSYDQRESCAGTGIVTVIVNPLSPTPTFIDSQDTLFVPYAINNYATNSNDEIS